jgi:photosystem II stability/assembly factor-like uncharacterized protein
MIKRILLLCLMIPLSITSILSQKINLDQWKAIKTRSIGPAAMSGRVTAIDVDIKNNIVYVGSASGGVWLSKNDGATFEPIFDKESTQSIGSIAVNQNNPADIWVGTGEGNPRNSQNFGDGIFRSIDGGKTWKNMGLKNTRAIHRIIIHKDDPNVVFAGVLGSAYGANEERGVFKTTDGGKTWRKVLYINSETGVADMIVDPSNPNKIIAAMWEYGRKPWTFSSGGKGSGIYVTHDGGETWEKRTEKDGLPAGEMGRCGLTICREKPNVLYAVVEAKENGIYRSNDGGFKWQKVGQNGDRPFYYAEIFCDPKNENRVYNIYSRVSVSEDGGRTWREILDYERVHPDHHAWWINPNDPSHMIDGNDGGLAITHDMAANWTFATNLPLGQFYHVNVDNDIPYNVYGGLQDNGSWVGPSAVWRSGGIRNADWQELYFGDGFDVMPRKDNIDYAYAMSQGGNLGLVNVKTGATEYIQPQHPLGVKLRYNWNAALAQNPFGDCSVYYASQFLHRTNDCGQTWEIISPDLTTNDTAKINASERTGGLTPDVTNAENHCTILTVAPSPVDRNVIWVGTDDGNVQLTTDNGKTWTNLSSKIIGMPKAAWIPQIEVSSKNAGEAFVIVNNYRQNDWKPYCFHTTDYGKTWRNIVNESQIPAYTLCFTQDMEESNLWFLGTDFGLYFTIDGGANWNKWANDLPSVPVMDMKIHPRHGDLVLGTFGRAFWVLDDIRPLRELARTKGDVLNKKFRVFPTPDAYLANSRSFQGERFRADAIYEGRNKSPMAIISIWNQTKPKAGDTKKEATATPSVAAPPAGGGGGGGRGGRGGGGSGGGDESKKVTVKVLTEGGDTIRTFKADIDTGMNRIFWPLNKKGITFPSWDDPRNETDEPSGGAVLPGRYKLLITYQGEKDSTYVNVKMDPRSEATAKDLAEKAEAMSDFQKSITSATKAMARLREADKTIGLIDGQLTNASKADKDEVAKMGKSLKESILNMKKMFMSAPDAKGIVRSGNALNNNIFKAMSLLNGSKGKPQSNALVAVAEAKKQIADVLTTVNKFFDNDWAKYQQKVEGIKYSLFKKYEPLKMD